MPEPPAESVSWVRGAAKVKRIALPVSLLVAITAVSGAFVAGNDAVCFRYLIFFLLLICHNELLDVLQCLQIMTTEHAKYARGMLIILFQRWVIHGYHQTFLT